MGIVGIAITSLGLGSLITFFVTRHDNKKNYYRLTQENAEEIREIKKDIAIIRGMSLGSLYDRAKFLGEQYIKRGYISLDEFADYKKYIYTPYHEGGGDGTIDKIMREVEELPIESKKEARK